MERGKKHADIAAIYQFKSKTNGKIYIGSTYSVYKRIHCAHLSSLKHNKHHNRYLQNHVNKYGINDIDITIIEYVDKHDSESVLEYKTRLLSREQYYIDTLQPEFNLTNAATSNLGIKMSDETLLRLQKWSGTPIIQYDLLGNKINEFLCIKEASRQTHIPRTSIINYIQGVRSCDKFIWGYLNEDISYKIEKNKNIITYPEVFQFDIQGNIVAKYKNTSEAREKTGIRNESINNCINGKIKQSRGFIWTHGNVPTIEQIKRANEMPVIHAMSMKEGIRHRLEKHKKAKMLENKIVEQYSMEGDYIKEYPSKYEATIETGIDGTHIYNCLNNKRLTTNRFIFIYKGDDNILTNKIKRIKSLGKTTYQFSLDGTFLFKYNSMAAAERKTRIKSIDLCLKGDQSFAGGYIFSYSPFISIDQINTAQRNYKKYLDDMSKHMLKQRSTA